MKIAVWSPLPPARTGIADYTAEMLPALARRHDVFAVVEDPAAVDPEASPGIPVVAARSAPESDLDVYQVGNSRAHVFAYRAALERPGVVVLHEWVLHDLVWHAAAERGDFTLYLREMRRSHGSWGSFVGRQFSRGFGGTMLPALFPANDRLLERSLGVVTLTREAGERLGRRHPRVPRLHLPSHLALPGPSITRAEARRALGLPANALIVTAPGFATVSKRLETLMHAVGRLRGEFPSLRLVLAGEIASGLPWRAWAGEAGLGDALVTTRRLPLEDLVHHLVAADVVSTLRFPSRGEMSAVLIRAMGVGRPVLVTAGTPATEEMPEGVVAPVSPGPHEREELVSVLRALLGSQRLREVVGAAAQAHVLAHHDLEKAARRLADFLISVPGRRAELQQAVQADKLAEGTVAESLIDEVRWAALDLGLGGLHLGLEPLLAPLGGRRAAEKVSDEGSEDAR